MDILCLLAQTTEAAEKTITWVERAIQGGPAVILGLLTVAFAAVIWWQNKKIRELEKEYRGTLENQTTMAIENTEKLIGALTTMNKVVESNEKALKDNHETMTRFNARLDAKERQGG